MKRAVRRLTSWYVEPRFAAQHEIDAELARFATESVRAIRQVHIELTDAKQPEADRLRPSQNDPSGLYQAAAF